MPESLVFNKVAGWPATLLKKRPWHRFWQISKNTPSYRTPRVAAFGISRHGATKQRKQKL